MAKMLSTDRGAASSKPGDNGARVDYAVKGERGLRLRVTGDKRAALAASGAFSTPANPIAKNAV